LYSDYSGCQQRWALVNQTAIFYSSPEGLSHNFDYVLWERASARENRIAGEINEIYNFSSNIYYLISAWYVDFWTFSTTITK